MSHALNTYCLYYVPGAMLCSGDVAVNKTKSGLVPHDTDIPVKEAKYKQVNL